MSPCRRGDHVTWRTTPLENNDSTLYPPPSGSSCLYTNHTVLFRCSFNDATAGAAINPEENTCLVLARMIMMYRQIEIRRAVHTARQY